MACRTNKVKKMQKGTKSVSKYNTGVKQIVVPEVTANTSTGTLTGATTGASVGSQVGSMFGPGGQLIGMGVGALGGALYGSKEARAQKREQEKAVQEAERYNAKMQDLQIGNTTFDTKTSVEQFAKGVKSIEIEGKQSPEIHTDKNFNIKNLGTIPHSKGGNKVIASDGDVIFNTQNNPSKYKKIVEDIKRYKLGDKLAKKRLEQERDSLPVDTGKFKQGGGLKGSDADIDNDGLKDRYGEIGEGINEIKLPNSDLTYGFKHKSPIVTPPVDTSALNQSASAIPTNVGTSDFSTLAPNDIFVPKGTTRATSVGAAEPKSQEGFKSQEKSKSPTLKNFNTSELIGLSKYASPLYKYAKSQESISKPKEVPLELQKLEYKDMSDTDRAEVDSQQAAINRQINRSGFSRGQALSQLAQSSTQAQKAKGAISQREQQIRQNIEQMNVNLTNQERSNRQAQLVRNQDIERKAEAVKESYLGEAMNEISNLGNLATQKSYLKSRDSKAAEMDEKTLQFIRSNNYKINPETWDIDFITAIKNETDPTKKKELQEAYARVKKNKGIDE